MRRIMLLNPKGGSGKTTLATNLASYYASRAYATVLIDRDGQGSSTRWLQSRPDAAPGIHGVAAYQTRQQATRSWQHRLPPETERVIIDTAAGVCPPDLSELIRGADAVIVPVLPSSIDLEAASDFIRSLGTMPAVRSRRVRVAVVANRVRGDSPLLLELGRVLKELGLPFVTRFRDAERYVRAAELGVGIHELSRSHARCDRQQWAPLLGWLGEKAEWRIAPRRAPVDEYGSAYAVSRGIAG